MLRKRSLSVTIVIALLISLVYFPINVKAYDYNTMYLKYAKKLRQKSKDNMYMAIVDSEQPVLLISSDAYTFDGNTMISMKAKIYQYSKKKNKIVYVGELYSGSSGCAISTNGKYLVCYFHHYAQRVLVKDASGSMDCVSDGITGITDGIKSGYSYSKIKLQDGKMKVLSSSNISENEYYKKYKKYVNNYDSVNFYKITKNPHKAFYISHCAGPKYSKGMNLNVTKLVKVGKKLKFEGNVAEAKSFENYSQKLFSYIHDGTFSVAGNCKYYISGGNGVKKKISQSRFIKEVNKNNMAHVTLTFETNNSGKICTMKIDTSM